MIAVSLASTDKEQEQVLTPFRSVCLRVQDCAHPLHTQTQKKLLLLHLSPTVLDFSSCSDKEWQPIIIANTIKVAMLSLTFALSHA